MQWCAGVFLLMATVFGHGNARVASGTLVTAEFNNEVEDVAFECPYKAVPNSGVNVMSIMHGKMKACVQPSVDFKRKMVTSLDTDAYRRLFRSACTQVPAVKACMAAVDANAASCLGEVERKVWATVLGFQDASIAATCANDGEVLATVFGKEFKAMSRAKRLRVLGCMVTTAAQGLFDAETDLPAYTLRKYRSIKSGKQCILSVAKQGQTSANHFEQLINSIIKNMTCVTPATYDIVPCDTLEPEHASGGFDN